MFPIDDTPPPRRTSLEGRLLRIVAADSAGVASRASDQFGITRQAVNRYLRILVAAGALIPSGNTRGRRYTLATRRALRSFAISEADEGQVWSSFVAPLLTGLKKTVGLAQYAFTEIYNNAIDHSEGTHILVSVEATPVGVHIVVADNGVGIFRKLVTTYGFEDEREAVIELVKGKLTTDRARHTGWGIFYSSRMCDAFVIFSGRFYFSHGTRRDWCFEEATPTPGTGVHMAIDTDPDHTVVEVLDKYSVEGSIGLDITHVPLALATRGEELLISRSQAKQVASRFDLFREVVLDFEGVDRIGQAFADELFRVWQRGHPDIQLVPLNTSAAVSNAISAAREQLLREVESGAQ